MVPGTVMGASTRHPGVIRESAGDSQVPSTAVNEYPTGADVVGLAGVE